MAAAVGDGPRLLEAAKQGDVEAVRALVRQAVDVNQPERDGATALHWAAHRDSTAVATLLVGAGARVDAVNDLGITPLSLACTNGSGAMVTLLLEAGANPNLAIATGETPLMTCARAGSVPAVSALLAKGAAVNTTEPSQQQTALMWAVAEGHLGVVQRLLAAGADVQARTKSGSTALLLAARAGALAPLDALIAAGAKVDDTAKDGATAVLIATMRGHTALVLALLDRGAPADAGGTGFTALHWAAGKWETRLTGPVGFVDPIAGIPDPVEKLKVVKALLAHKADPNALITKQPPRYGDTSFRQNLVGATPFFMAAQAADVEVMKALIAGGADPALRSKDGTTPLMIAAGENRTQMESHVTEPLAMEAVNYILSLGKADVNEVNDAGQSALHGLAYLGWNQMIQQLVDKGAKVNMVSRRGLTPLIIAEGHGDRNVSTTVQFHPDTAALLRKLGADDTLGIPIP